MEPHYTTDPRHKCLLRRLVWSDRRATAHQLAIQMKSGATRHVSNTTVQQTLLQKMPASMLTADHQTNAASLHSSIDAGPLLTSIGLLSYMGHIFSSTG